MHENEGAIDKAKLKGTIKELVYVTDLLKDRKAFAGREIAVKGKPYSVASANFSVPNVPGPYTDWALLDSEEAARMRSQRTALINKTIGDRSYELMRQGESPKVALAKATQEAQANVMAAEATGMVASAIIIQGLDAIDRGLYSLEPDQLSVVMGDPKLPNKKLLCRSSGSNPTLIARLLNEVLEGDDIVAAGYFDGNVLKTYEIYVNTLRTGDKK
jgi:hypothetical protein